MGDFGFDPYVIANYQRLGNETSNNDMRTLADVSRSNVDTRAAQFHLGQQQRLADLVSHGVDPVSAYQQAGDPQGMLQAQIQRFEMGQKMLGWHRDITMSQSGTVKTPEQAEQFISRMSPDVRSMYGFSGDEKGQEALDAVQRFRQSAITPEQQAELAQKKAELNKNRFNLTNVDSTPYLTDSMTGKTRQVPLGGGGGGGVGQGGDVPAPVGSKRFTAKQEALKALGEDMDPTSGRSDLAVSANAVIQNSQRLEGVLDSPGPMTPQRLREAAVMVATIANGGHVPNENQIEEQIPETLRGKSAEWWQKTTGLPQDVNMKPFTDMWRSQSEREKAIAKKQIRDFLLSRLPKHPEVFKNWNAEANQVVSRSGLNGLYDPKTGVPYERVKVKYKGKIGTVLSSQLQDALKDGAVEVK